jgi:hypothetical protein
MRTVRRLTVRAACICVLAAAVMAVGNPAGAPPPAKTFAGQPAHTYIPSAPGIAIALSSFDLPDPFILNANGKYYLYLSSAYGNATQNVPLLVGGPGHWSRHSIDAVPQLPAWAIGDPSLNDLTWSPAVYKFGRRYVMYLAPQIRGSNPIQHCIAIASASRPTGPFVVSPTPFVCQGNLGGDIDPEVFVDPHGPDGPTRPNYFIWKSDNNSTPGDGLASIWAQPLSNDGSTLEGNPVLIFQTDETWQSTLVEAPQMALSPNGSVWMFFSAGQGYFSTDYGMGAVRCTGPLGPCTHPLPGPLITTNDQGSGPGEETYFIGPDGSDWLLYSPVHTGDAFETFRPVEAARIGWNSAGPYVADAGLFPSPGRCRGRASHAASRSQGCTR